eukprot:1787610-Rhodomonas_salina.1
MADGNGGEATPAATSPVEPNEAKTGTGCELEEDNMTIMVNEGESFFLSEEMQAELCSHLKQEGARHGFGEGVARLPSSAVPYRTVSGAEGRTGSADDGAVMIQADGWMPDFETLSPEMQLAPSTATRATSAAVVKVDYLQCKACYRWNPPSEANCAACQAFVDPNKALHLSKLVTDTQITESLRSLRAALCEAFTKKRILDGGWELERKLKGGRVDREEEGKEEREEEREGGADLQNLPSDMRTSSSVRDPSVVDTLTFVTKLSEFGVHALKRHVRPLFSHPQLRRNGGIQAEAIAGLLNAKPWWPSEESITAAEGLDNEQIRKELEELLGPKLSKAISGEHSDEYLKELLEQIRKDPGALNELKIFLDSIPAEEYERRSGLAPVKGPGSWSRSRSPAIRAASPAAPPPRPHSSAEISNERASPSPGPKRTPSALGLADKKLKPYVSSLETKAPVVSQKWPYGKLSKEIAHKSTFEWKTWEDKKTGMVHEPIPVPLPELGSSRKRGNEFYSQMSQAAKGERESMDHSKDFWRKLSRPNMAVEYMRWQLLEQPIAGFSSPHLIEPKKNPTPWKPLKNVSQFKMGSRHADPQTEAIEQLTPTTMLTNDLKVERNKSKMVLEGTECLKRTRLHVIRGSYDLALEETEAARSKFKSAGKYGQMYAKEVENPQHRVVAMIKAEMDKLLKVAKEALERSQWDKAMSHIPRLRQVSQLWSWTRVHHVVCTDMEVWFQACAWLDAQGVVYPEAREATHWEIRKQISRVSFPEGMKVIDDVQRDIEQSQRAAALQLDTTSTASFFAAVLPVLDLSDHVQLAEVEAATNKRNRLPKNITADGSTYLMVVDLKSPDLPEKIKVGTPVFVRGERTLDSGKSPGAEDWLSGTVVSWNIRGDKYKVQYDNDDYEWIQTPTDLEVEINMFPEEVLIEADGFVVRSMTHQHPKLGKKVAVVAFTIVPPSPGYDLTLFREIELRVTGVKSQKRLVEDGPRSRALILPPKFLQPGSMYTIYDSITGKMLDGEVDFIHTEDQTTTTFAAGQPVELPKEGVYTIVARGEKEIGYPYTSEYSTCMWNAALQTQKEENQRGEVRLHLNKHIARADELRVVVTWGSRPGALDSYTYTSERDKVEWRRTGKKVNGICLNIDTVAGYGPETITIRVKKGVGYSFSLKMTEGQGVSDLWTTSGAKVSLFDHTGAVAVFQVPPVRQGIKGMWWWHVFALDSGLWEKPGHGLLRVNQLSTHELAQVCL